jgi:hypothetical protein
MSIKKVPILFLLSLLTLSVNAQFYFRIECDISIKTKLADGTSSLTMGKAFYDRNTQKLVYDIRFPNKEIWVIKDTNVFTIANNQLIKKEKIVPLVQYTIFNIVLEGSLDHFGLKNSMYKATDVEQSEDLVITTWQVPEKYRKEAGKILTSTKNRELYGVIIYSPEGEILSKQLYKNYQTHNGIKIPGEIIQVIYNDGKESYQVISFKEVKINNMANEEYYNYHIPVH